MREEKNRLSDFSDLSNNKIRKVAADAFHGLKFLESLYVYVYIYTNYAIYIFFSFTLINISLIN